MNRRSPGHEAILAAGPDAECAESGLEVDGRAGTPALKQEGGPEQHHEHHGRGFGDEQAVREEHERDHQEPEELPDLEAKQRRLVLAALRLRVADDDDGEEDDETDDRRDHPPGYRRRPSPP